MNKPLLYLLFFFTALSGQAQIITPVIKSGFGVDGDLRANFHNNTATPGNDDWFWGAGTGGSNVIDTTGAAALLAGYASDTSPYARRMASVIRPMRVAPYTIVDGRLWLDALFVRDFHGTDQTVFTQGSSKNGMSPGQWGGTTQSVPDKNEILDMMMHLRRAGDGRHPGTVDSLWFFGGLSIENTSGNRYFDFELYQTDIYYDASEQKFHGYGPDAGHTSWQFDASGKVTQVGDIIFSASYQSAMLTGIEARIWIDKASLNITPTGFSWSGQFDGASTSAQFGYASILPNTTGFFYTGLENSGVVSAGPFKLVRVDNTLADDYSTGQFMEFSVNLTKLGIDPATMQGGDMCRAPFNRMIVKTRASESFTSALKDFVAPVDLFTTPHAKAATNVPFYCGANGISELRVLNPSPSSVYTWATPNGHVVGTSSGANVIANAPGIYIVTQQLAEGCLVYAVDTVTIIADPSCTTLSTQSISLQVSLNTAKPQLSWTSAVNDAALYYELEASAGGETFTRLSRFENKNRSSRVLQYSFEDISFDSPARYYRVKVVTTSGSVYSKIVFVEAKSRFAIAASPNPAVGTLCFSITGVQDQPVRITAYGMDGRMVYNKQVQAPKGTQAIAHADVQAWPEGTYVVVMQAGSETRRERVVVQRRR